MNVNKFFRFHKLLRNEPFVHVHICNLAAQTGVTRYTQINDRWMYSKNESLPFELLQDYTHLVIEAKSKYSSNLKSFSQTHSILDSIESFSQVSMHYKIMPPVKIKTKPALFILERKDFREFPFGHNIRSFDPSPIFIDKTIPSEENIVDVVNYDTFDESGSKESDVEINVAEPGIKIDTAPENERFVDVTESILDEDLVNNFESDSTIFEETQEPIVEEVIEIEEVKKLKLQKAKKALDELKLLRQERKKKAIEKIKSETRREVVASAKEKLKEIMKRHKHIAVELSESIISDITVELETKDGRGDIPEEETIPEDTAKEIIDEVETNEDAENNKERIDEAVSPNKTNENVDIIVEEVILRLIDRKIYDDKTKPEDMKPEDRLMIQKIVEEVLAEKFNYSSSDSSK